MLRDHASHILLTFKIRRDYESKLESQSNQPSSNFRHTTMFLKTPQIRALVLLLWQSMAVMVLSIPTDFSIAGYNPYPTNAHKLHIAQLFEQWMETHEKIYSQPEDRTRGFENFLRNYEYVNGRNANGGHSVGMNNLADLSNEEFREKYLSKFQMGKRRERRVGSYSERNYESCDAPPSLNWEEKGVVTAVKNQGQCGKMYFLFLVD